MATGLSAQPEDGFSPLLENLTRKAELARARGSGQDVEPLVQDLEAAAEELRVAEEELRVQGEHVARLLRSRDVFRWRYERITASLPVAVLTTDRHGRLRSVNPSAAALFGVRIDHLLRKPLFVFLDESDRHVLRQTLSWAWRGQAPEPCSVTLRTRQSEVAVVAYAGSVEPSEREVSWLLLERDLVSSTAVRSSETRDPAAGLPSALVALSALSARTTDVSGVLQETSRICAGALGPGADVMIDVGHPVTPLVVATTSAIVQTLDGWQTTTGQGPAVSAYDSGEVVTTAHVLADSRWPDLRPRDRGGVGLGACVSVPLRSPDGVSGVLSVVLDRERSLTPTLVHVVETLGAAVASQIQELDLRSALQTLQEEMRTALSSRAVIDQAKGVVMADRHCTADEAFEHLVRLSNTTHRKVRDVAQLIVDQVTAP